MGKNVKYICKKFYKVGARFWVGVSGRLRVLPKAVISSLG
jgi:hypothetical protein